MSNGYNFTHSLYTPPITPGTTVGARETRPLVVVFSKAADNLRDNRAVLAWVDQNIKDAYVLAPDVHEENALENALARVEYYRSINLIDDVYVTGDDVDAVEMFAFDCPNVTYSTTFTDANLALSERTVVNLLFNSEMMARPYLALLMNAVDDAEGILAAADYSERYTPAKRTAFETALAAARMVLASPEEYTDLGILAIWTNLYGAITALTEPENAARADLAWWINHAQELLDEAEKYIPASVQNLQTALEDATDVFADTGATDIALYAEVSKLQEAVWQCYVKGDKAVLQQLYDLVKDYDGTIYTSESWQAFSEALLAAQTVLADPNAIEDDVLVAYQDLLIAEGNLQRLAIIDFSALNAALAMGQRILDNRADYIASTIVGLSGLMNAGNALLVKVGVTQSEVTAATAALRQAISTARLKPNKSNLFSALGFVQTLNLGIYTDATISSLAELVAKGEALINTPDEQLEQAQIDSIAQQILQAIEGLSLLSASNGTSGNGGGAAANSVTAVLSANASAGTVEAAISVDGQVLENADAQLQIGDGQIPAGASANTDTSEEMNGYPMITFYLAGLLLIALIVIALLVRKLRRDGRADV
jgi:hypothetical protein